MYTAHLSNRLLVTTALVLGFLAFAPHASAAIVAASSSTGDNTKNGATSIVISAPLGVTSGDLLLADITVNKGTITSIATPTGWTLIRRTDNSNKVGLATYYKVAGASEPTTYTWVLGKANTAVGGIVRYTGVQISNPVDTTSDGTGRGGDPVAPVVTTSVANEKIVSIFSIADNHALGTATGMFEIYDVSNPSSNGPATALNDMTQETIGTVAASSAALGNPPRDWVAQHIVLRPIPPVGTLHIVKTVINDNLGTSTPRDFSFQVNNGPITAFNTSGVNDYSVTPGIYTVTEIASNRYTPTYTNCSNVSVVGGATTTCTISNNDIPGAFLTVRKVVVGGSAVPSDFALSINSSPVQSGVQNFLAAGNYSVTEQGPSGYRTVYSGDCDANGQISLVSNNIKTCTSTSYVLENALALCSDGIDNDQNGLSDLFDPSCEALIPRLTILSTAINNNGGAFDGSLTQFDIKLPNPASPYPGTAIQNISFPNEYRTQSGPPITLKINPGDYQFKRFYATFQNLGNAYSLSNNCSGSIAIGEEKTCILTFDDIAPTLIVINHVVNNNGGSSVAGDFAVSVSGTSVSTSSFPGDESGVLVSLNPGSYSVSETGPSGYIQNLSAGCSGSLGLGQTQTCVITNSQLPLIEDALPACTDGIDNDSDNLTDLADSDCAAFIPRLSFVTNVVNDDGGSFDGNFTQMDVAVPNPANSLPGTVVQNTGLPNVYRTSSGDLGPFKLNPGSYGFVRYYTDQSAQYSLTKSADCNGLIGPGDSKVCTLTFNDIPPSLTVKKHVVNLAGGTLAAGDFTVTVSGTNVSTTSFAGDEGGTILTMHPGAYSVSSGQMSGYIQSLSADCTGTISLGQSKTCVITDSDTPLVENTLNACIDGTDNDQDGTTDLYDTDCDTYIPRLTINSSVTNDDGGTFDGALSQFDIKLPNPASPYPGTAVQNIGFPDEYRTQSGPPITLKINPGQYKFKRLYSFIFNLESKYAVTNNCSGTANPGDNRTCTISFNDIAPTLTIIKHVVNDNGGTASAGDFTMNVAGDTVSSPAFTGSEAGTIITLHPGAYSVTENELNGYSVLAGTNCAGSIGLGESRTCTITSDDIPPALTLIKNVINDNAGTATSTDWTLAATGPTSISGNGFVTSETTSAFSAGGYVLSESTGPSGYIASDWTCTGDVTSTGTLISLAIGQNAQCTSTSDDNP